MTENEEAKFKQQAILRAEPGEEMYMTHKESDITINTSENTPLCCQISRWIDKVSVVLFPMLFIGFNVGYWQHYLP